MSESILEGPALTPPSGVTPDLVNPPNQNVMADVVMGILVTITLIIVPLRLWTRFFVMKERKFVGDCELSPCIPARVSRRLSSCIQIGHNKTHDCYRR